jgi:hypothetical protein
VSVTIGGVIPFEVKNEIIPRFGDCNTSQPDKTVSLEYPNGIRYYTIRFAEYRIFVLADKLPRTVNSQVEMEISLDKLKSKCNECGVEYRLEKTKFDVLEAILEYSVKHAIGEVENLEIPNLKNLWMYDCCIWIASRNYGLWQARMIMRQEIDKEKGSFRRLGERDIEGWEEFWKSPKYEPPYDSPLEDLFALNLVKYLGSDVTLRRQFEVSTMVGKFRIDFVVELDGWLIAFECDGKEYHIDVERDDWRDAIILGGWDVDVIYRLYGPDLYHHLEDCLYMVSVLDPFIFSDRGITSLGSLASKAVKEEINPYEIENDHKYRAIRVYYPDYWDEYGFKRGLSYISVKRRSADTPPDEVVHWRKYYEYANRNPGLDLDNLIEKYRKHKL